MIFELNDKRLVECANLLMKTARLRVKEIDGLRDAEYARHRIALALLTEEQNALRLILRKAEFKGDHRSDDLTDQEDKFQSLLAEHYISLLEKVSVPPQTIRETDNYAPTGRGTAK